MKWFREHKIFSVIAAIILVQILIIAGSLATAGGTGMFGRALQTAASAVAKPFEAVTSGIGNTVSGIINFRDTQKENIALKEENAKLRQENQELKLKKSQLEELRDLSKAFSFEPFRESSTAIAGNITEIDYSNPYIVFTIDAGKEDGIAKNDIVVDGKGLVGYVQETGRGWSKVKSILSTSNNISFKVLRDTSVTGVLHGNGKHALSGYLMENSDRVIKGDTLVTTGIGRYPEGIRIGTVTKVSFDDDHQLKTVKVEPTVKFGGLTRVAVFK
ncbi:MAG: rod shape-determining protein MreC [Anaerovoracaceae bacterium]|nr:rod shape-determining protein MreC [Anaerovoracaceae bacterium]